MSNAERRALVNGEPVAVPRVSDVYASLPSLTGKIELEYEGELKGAETVARELVRQAVATVFDGHATATTPVPSSSGSKAAAPWICRTPRPPMCCSPPSTPSKASPRAMAALGVKDAPSSAPLRASLADFVLEGLCALRKITRTDEGRLLGTPSPSRSKNSESRHLEQLMEDDEPAAKGKKKYYN